MDRGRGRNTIKSLRGILLLLLVVSGLLALLRVPWAVRLWRRARLAAWAYVILIIVLAIIYAYRFWG
jgi:NADH:ubiquinone oxidoreductase subunit 3 (subunit A)